MFRQQQLSDWLASVLKTESMEQYLLAGDASARRYYRVANQGVSYVVMDAPPPESCQEFVEKAELLRKHAVNVREIIAANLSDGFLLLSDFGDTTYFSALNSKTVGKLYQDAFFMLARVQRCPTVGLSQLPFFEQAKVFETWYLKQYRQLEYANEILPAIYEPLKQVFVEQPTVVVHLDYHSRNLMVVDENNPGVLDFQDACLGPITYDLVSLLQDCYLDWPRAEVEHWVAQFQKHLQREGQLSASVTKQEFLRWFDWTGVQRHLKNLGVFARLSLRDGKPDYLKNIPRMLGYLAYSAKTYPELAPLMELLEVISPCEQ